MKVNIDSIQVVYKVISCSLIVLAVSFHSYSQEKYFKDSTDQAVDISNWIIDAHGFVPVPSLITEPAIGYGGAVALVFMKKKEIPDDVKQKYTDKTFIPPDITAAIGAYTENGTWVAGAARIGTFVRPGLRYKLMAAYMNLNITFYEDIPEVGEQAFDFTIKATPVYLYLTKQIPKTDFHVGAHYVYAYTKVEYNGTLPEFVTPKEIDNNSSIAGVVVQYDIRDNSFTPNKGTFVHLDVGVSDDAIGSDFDYVESKMEAIQYFKPIPKWVAGFRLEGASVVSGNIPFYLKPYIDLRGIPSARYQGNYVTVAETEHRVTLYKRWVGVGFVGCGKAIDEWDEWSDETLAYNYGIGGRYLIARKFGLQMGVDVARGPEDYAFYIVFGSSWMR